ncbi:VCBS repeat-containing protein [Nibrella viscosa]|uniref:VCBS repeat-containing protein n=1 Tax=Nibrella viscosa TaxID=1084524 RepID=A0ABP8KSM8_9BACT
MKYTSFFTLLLVVGISACRTSTQFELLSPNDTHITFGNALTIADTMNILDNELVYNGAGVSVGDWNGDGLQDLFFTANMVDNALYLNKGNLEFEDITRKAGVSKPNKCWSAGSTVVDINADGKLDLYVSNMMYGDADLRRNLLYVNQGNDGQGVPHFKELGREYGLDSDSHSAQTVFFDYDNDGDLDAYILVNVMDMQYANQYLSKQMQANSPTADRLLRNMTVEWRKGRQDERKTERKSAGANSSPFFLPSSYSPSSPLFIDVSREAGIEAQGYGHGVSVMDINQDGWLDIYVTNDYLSNDNLFINQRDGTFKDAVHDCMKHLSWSAMGNDVADINNDGLPDIVAMDMLPDYNERKKALLRANNYTHYIFTEQYQYEYQHIRNTLQLNRGLDPQTGLPRFSDIGQMAGISETDWSWCPLWLDADNDGYRDLFITNGFPKDITDQDFLAYRNDIASVATSKAELYRMIPEVKIPNYVYRNRGDLTFADKSKEWGFDTPTFSNGAAYADLDNDGDLDLVVNNTNDYAYVYRNTLNEQAQKPHYLRIRLTGPNLNPMGVGATVQVFAGSNRYFAEQNIVRGYLSTSEPILHFGLGNAGKADSVRIAWPDGRQQTLTNIPTDQVLTVVYQHQAPGRAASPVSAPLWTSIMPELLGLTFQHTEGDYIDFNVQKTLPHKFSQQGPGIAVGDVNGDGLDDFFVGGSSKVEGSLFLQQANGTFNEQKQKLKHLTDAKEEDLGVLLFDADGDGDLDLYCARGSYQHEAGSPYLQDALYVNDGRGHFRRDSLALPHETSNTLTVRAADFDRDGDLDLFVGGSTVPRAYPQADRSFLLRNDSPAPNQPHFTDVTQQIAPQLTHIGIISDALWTDYNNDGWPDLLLAGEWMPITILQNQHGKRITQSTTQPLNQATGWWTSLCAGDFDNDGDTDYLAGNYGLNTAYKASEAEPLWVYANDFDSNGSYDAILAQHDNNAKGERHLYPYHTRDDMIKQSLLFRRRFLKYEDFGKATWEQVLTPEETKNALIRKATFLQSCYLENLGNGQFRMSPLPTEAQLAPIFGMLPCDIDADGLLDMLLVGNDYGMELVQGQADAAYGLVLKNLGDGRFQPLPMAKSGFVVPGDARAITRLQLGKNRQLILATQNRGRLQAYELPNPTQRFIPLRPDDAKAILTFANGRKRQVEVFYGSTYLSQEYRRLCIDQQVRQVELITYQGQRRQINL